MDYRKMNSITKKDQYPLSALKIYWIHWEKCAILALLTWCQDIGRLKQAKKRIRNQLWSHTAACTSLCTCLLGCTMSVMFQRLMEVVLDGMLWKVRFVYIDDVFVPKLLKST